MRILAIETSCDETAVSIIEAHGSAEQLSFQVVAHAVHSQIEVHRPYGGVFPALAKREHAEHIVPVLEHVFKNAKIMEIPRSVTNEISAKIQQLLEREGDLSGKVIDFCKRYSATSLDAICVTSGPGLEPALWVGIQTAQALGSAWDLPVYPVNHMEGHVVSVLAESASHPANKKGAALSSIDTSAIRFPLLSLLISGGHTELVTGTSFIEYQKIGATRDDAVGEAFDKVARVLGLPYPGGPEISKNATAFRERLQQAELANIKPATVFPRPMITSGDYDFSFSGLKTAVLYHVKRLMETKNAESSDTTLTAEEIQEIACAFEDAVTDVLIAKTRAALIETQAQTLVIAGGVAANTHIRKNFTELIAREFPDVVLLFPHTELATDNSVMIAIAGYFEILKNPIPPQSIVADGNWSLDNQ